MNEEEIRQQRKLFVGEDEWRQVDKLVFFPVGPLKQCWDFAVLVCVIFSCVTVPYRNSFGEAEGEEAIVERVVLAIFILDLAATFNTAYQFQDRWVVHRPAIARQ